MASSKIVTLRVPDTMLRFVTHEAERRGLSVGGYLKFLVQKEMEK